MIIRKLERPVYFIIVYLSIFCSSTLAQYEDVGTLRIKIVNLTSPTNEDIDLAPEDVDLMADSYGSSLMGQQEREGPPIVNKSSTGQLLVDANHKIGSCPPAYTVSIGSCIETCRSDKECPNNWKCCPNECGKNMCSAPIQSFGWYHWGQWGECSATCGGGVRVRSRNCNFPGRLIEQKKYCHGNHYELAPCNTKRCPHYVSSWMQWSSWSTCSAKCGGGVSSRYRFRVCAEKESDENIFCDDFQVDLAECNYESCPDVVYSNWSGWSQCSRSCGTGLMARFRSCPFCPFTGYVGECSGPNYDYKVCTGPPCKGDNHEVQEEWSDWTRCTKDCDKGLRLAIRKNSDCKEGDDECKKFLFKSQICNPQKCPAIAGDLGHWSAWSECSADGCEEGFQFSSRDCSHPQPWNGGRYCQGKPFELRVCNLCKIVNGEWSAWEPWTECSASCGGGIRSRRRRCDNPAPLYGGKYCPGEHFKLESCNTDSCDLKEGYEWGCWGPCSRKCGGGDRVRYAICNALSRESYEEVCDTDPYEDETCNTKACNDEQEREKSQLAVWTPWSSCSHTCGLGTRVRYSYSVCPAGEGRAISQACSGYNFEIKKCQTRPCERKAIAWKHWSAWSPCSTNCGGGVTMRIRECASHGINQHIVCPGLSYELQTCNTAPCDHYRQDYAAWGAWSLPTPCSGQCSENGYRANVVRLFSCGSPDANDCPRIEVKQVQCDYRSCYKENNFIYPEWSDWTPCTKSCGGGYTYRNRTFSDDLPVNGDFCTKHPFEVALCNRESCDADGGWSDWSVWSTCTASCNGGMRARRRACNNPAPRGTGKYCLGDHFVSQQCNLQICVKHGAEWSAWTPCSRPCGGGERVRFADCHDDENCCKKPYTVEKCNEEPCKQEQSVSFKMLEWTEWSSCSKTCGCGMRTRYRFPDCSGFDVNTDKGECSGFEIDVERCGDGECEKSAAIKEQWDEWSEWASCSVSCGGGIRQRVRECLSEKPEECPGSSHGFDMCHTDVCPGVPLSRQILGFGEWTEWTACSVEMGRGIRERARFKLFSESRAHEPDMELQNEECTGAQPAVTSGGYSEWSSWSACTKTCGGGVQHRFRSIVGSSPCGDDCKDSLAETKACGEKECIRFRDSPEFVGDWSAWSSCSRTCGGGIQTRRRQCMIVSVPEYVFAPGKVVTEKVTAPPPRPQSRSACLGGSTTSTSGIELGGCAIIFCPGELERFDVTYDNQVPQYQPYTPGYAYTTTPSYAPAYSTPRGSTPNYAYTTSWGSARAGVAYDTPTYDKAPAYASPTPAYASPTPAYPDLIQTYATVPYNSSSDNTTDYPVGRGRMRYNESHIPLYDYPTQRYQYTTPPYAYPSQPYQVVTTPPYAYPTTSAWTYGTVPYSTYATVSYNSSSDNTTDYSVARGRMKYNESHVMQEHYDLYDTTSTPTPVKTTAPYSRLQSTSLPYVPALYANFSRSLHSSSLPYVPAYGNSSPSQTTSMPYVSALYGNSSPSQNTGMPPYVPVVYGDSSSRSQSTSSPYVTASYRSPSPAQSTNLPYVTASPVNCSKCKSVYQPVPPPDQYGPPVYAPGQTYQPELPQSIPPGQLQMGPSYQGWGSGNGKQIELGKPYQFVNSSGHAMTLLAEVLISKAPYPPSPDGLVPPKPLPAYGNPPPIFLPIGNTSVFAGPKAPAVVYQGPVTISPSEAEANKLYKESVEADYDDYEEAPRIVPRG